MIEMKTIVKGSKFNYDGSLKEGVSLFFGKNTIEYISIEQCSHLIHQFKGKRVFIGTSRDKPQPGSLGEWLKDNVTKRATASYVAPILVREGYATVIGKRELQF